MPPTRRKPVAFSAALSAAVAAVLLGTSSNRAHAANVDNTTVQIAGTANNTGLFGQIYGLTQPNVVGVEPSLSTTVGGSPNYTATGFPTLQTALSQATLNQSGYSNVNFNNTNFGTTGPFNVAPYNSTLTDNITARWSGYISLPAGVSTFATNSDDGSVIYIDGVRVVNNNLFQGNTRRIGQTQSFAAAGQHEIVIAFYEGTGGAGVEARYAPGLATTTVTDPAFVIIPVVDAGTNQILTGVQNTALTPVDGDLTFATAGTTGSVDFTNALQVNMGALTFAGGNTLNYEGAAARFTSTTFNGGGTNVLAVSTNSAFSQDIALGQLSDGGGGARLQKTGPGQLVLDQTTNANTIGSTSVIEIRGGGLVLAGTNAGQNPAGSATIELGSVLPSPAPTGVIVLPSTLSLTSKAGNVAFDNAVNVTSSNTIIAQQLLAPANSVTLAQGSSVGVPTAPTAVANVTVSLGSATNAVTVASGQTVTFQANNGYTLNLAGGVGGAGNVVFAPGTISLGAKLTNTGTITMAPGGATTVVYNTDNALNNRALTVPAGEQVNVGAGVTSLGGDSIVLVPASVLAVPNATVAALFTRDVNLTAPALSVIAETAAGAASAVQGLGTNGDLYFGLAANLSDNFTVGSIPGVTPFRGISTDRVARTLTGGTITAASNFQFANVSNANLTTQAITVATPNGPVVASVTMGTGRVLLGSNASGLNSNVTFTLNAGAIQLTADRALGSSTIASQNARIVGYPGTTIDPNGIANTMSGNIFLLNGAILQLNDANNLGGIGAITGESGSIVQLQNATALGNANAAQTLSTLPAGVVYRMEQNLGVSLAANTNPAGNYQVQGADRTNSVTLSAGNPTRSGYLSGVLSNDGASRTFQAAGSVTIGAGGATFASSPTFTLTIAAPVTVSPGGGRTLTVGSTRILDPASNSDVRNGTVVLSSTTNNFGTGADALAGLTIMARANLQNAVAAGVTALPQGPNLAVSLGGFYQVNGGSGAGTSTIELGQVTPQGGTILLNRNATTPDTLQVRLNAPISRSNTFGPGGRGSMTFQTTVGQTLGTSEKVIFANAAHAPARISGTSGPINMVAPWMIGTDANTATAISTFLDVDPASATSTGFIPVTYVAMPLTGGTGDEIADRTTAAALTGAINVAALRTSANISGQTINLSTGGLLFRGSAAAVTISSGIDFDANEGVITNISGQANIISGLLSGTGGLTKHGANSLALSNAGSTLTGGITINEFNLRPGVNNGIPQNNVVTINAAGVLELNGFNQSFLGLQGNGVVRNEAAGARTLTLDTQGAGDAFEFTGTIRNGAQPVALTKTGSGTEILSGTLGHTGATSVNGGRLLVNGLSTAASAYTIGSGATLGGLGIITGSITGTANSILAPGGHILANEAGQLRSGNLALTGATLALDLNGPVVGDGLGSSSSYDQLDVVGTVALTNANLQVELSYVPVVGQKLFVLNNDGIDFITGAFTSLNGTPTTLSEGSIFSLTSTADSQSYDFRISYLGEFYADNVNVGNDVVLVAVPEPSAVLSLVGGLGILLASRRARRS